MLAHSLMPIAERIERLVTYDPKWNHCRQDPNCYNTDESENTDSKPASTVSDSYNFWHIGLCLLTRNLRLLGAVTKLTATRLIFAHYRQWIELDVYWLQPKWMELPLLNLIPTNLYPTQA